MSNVLQTITMPHQWMEGNLPVSAKCAVCDKTCGSVLRYVSNNIINVNMTKLIIGILNHELKPNLTF